MYSRKFLELNETELKSPVVVLGLPGIANVGRVAVESLIEVLGAIHYMDIFSDDFPPRIIVKDGISHIPKSSLYLYRAAPDESHDLIILTALFQPSSSQGVFEYADFVSKEFVSLGVKEVFALAAYEQGYEEFFSSFPNEPRAFISASSQSLLDRITQLDGTIATESGVVNGANGFIPAWAANMYNMEGACLLGETLSMIKMDFRAAKSLLEKIVSLLDLKANFDILDDQVLKVTQFIEWAKEEVNHRGRESTSGESPPDRYIG